MNTKGVRTLQGSPRPPDLFQPHMPDVELLPDMDELFTRARSLLAAGGVLENEQPGQRFFAIVTPGRLITFEPGPPPGGMPNEAVKQIEQILPSNPPLNISVITYTLNEALMKDKTRCIPFFGYLAAFAYMGHSVVVFEGHPSAFESGVRHSDVLLVDSGMMPFMVANWGKVAHRVMKAKPRIFVHDRETYTLMQVELDEGEHSSNEERRPWWKIW